MNWLRENWWQCLVGTVAGLALTVIGVGMAAALTIAVRLMEALRFTGALDLHVEWTKQ